MGYEWGFPIHQTDSDEGGSLLATVDTENFKRAFQICLQFKHNESSCFYLFIIVNDAIPFGFLFVSNFHTVPPHLFHLHDANSH